MSAKIQSAVDSVYRELRYEHLRSALEIIRKESQFMEQKFPEDICKDGSQWHWLGTRIIELLDSASQPRNRN